MYMYDEIALMLWGHEEAISAFVHNTRFSEFWVKFFNSLYENLQKPMWAKSAKIYEKPFSATGVIGRKTQNSQKLTMI